MQLFYLLSFIFYFLSFLSFYLLSFIFIERPRLGAKGDLFWRGGFAKCSSFIFRVHTVGHLYSHKHRHQMNPPCMVTTYQNPPSANHPPEIFWTFFHFSTFLLFHLQTSLCRLIFSHPPRLNLLWALSCFPGFARHSHGSTWFPIWNFYQTTLLQFKIRDITFQLLEETFSDLIFPRLFLYL